MQPAPLAPEQPTATRTLSPWPLLVCPTAGPTATPTAMPTNMPADVPAAQPTAAEPTA
jgi:hypothetical protein